MYGVINPKDQFFFFDLDNKESIHNCIVTLSKKPGFYNYNDIVKLYNTALHMISNSGFNKDIVNLFKEIAKGLNLIQLLKVDNKYTNFLEKLDTYSDRHEEIIKLWDSDEDICIYDSYIYNNYSFTEMPSDEFHKIVSDESENPILVEHGIHTLYEDKELSGCISKDIHDKIKNQLYYIPKHKTGNLKKDIALSLSCILTQVSKFESRNSDKDNVMYLGMNIEGFHCEHIVAVNILLSVFNYLLNSTSIQNNELYMFDEIEVIKRIENAKLIINRIPLLIKSRLD